VKPPTTAVTLAMTAMLAMGCGGKGDACRTSDDCSGGLVCIGPNDPPQCGIAPKQECATNAACSSGSVCHAIYDTCSADGGGSQCDAPCTGDAPCGDGFRCADAGACVAVLCTEGLSCTFWQVCDPAAIPTDAPVYDRHHGCQTVACEDDAPCPSDSVCVNGSCQSGLGSCGEEEIVP
jgi:hypothetical protein